VLISARFSYWVQPSSSLHKILALPQPTDIHTQSAMAKDRESSKPSHAHPEKEEKKKKKKRSDEDGVHKSSDKKDKKEKKAKREALAEKALNETQTAPAAADAKSDEEGEVAEAEAENKQELRPVGALVPFANPLADEKVAKKVFKSVKKGSYRAYVIKKRFLVGRLALKLTLVLGNSGRATHAQTGRERSRQGAPQSHRPDHRIVLSHRRRDPRSRHLAHGRHLAHSGALRRPQHPVHLRDVAGGAGHGGADEAADKRGDGCRRGGEEEGGRGGGQRRVG
jgi:hypothetical protein